MKVSTKIHIPLVLALLFGLSIIMFTSYQSINTIRQGTYQDEAKSLVQSFEQKFQAKTDVALSNAINIAHNYFVISALQENKRAIAIEGLQPIIETYNKYTKFKNIKIHLHDKNVNSFVRLWKLDKYGDDLKGFRNTIVATKQYKKPLATIELGRAGLILRGLSPVMLGEQYLGSVEFMQDLNSIVTDAKQEGLEVAIFMRSQYIDVATKLQSAPRLSNQFVLASKPSLLNSAFFDELKTVDISKMGKTAHYFYTSVAIKDFQDKIVGYAVMGKALSKVEAVVSMAQSALFTQVSVMVLIDVIVLFMLAFVIHKIIIAPIKYISEVLSSGEGDLNKRLDINSHDELAIIAM